MAIMFGGKDKGESGYRPWLNQRDVPPLAKAASAHAVPNAVQIGRVSPLAPLPWAAAQQAQREDLREAEQMIRGPAVMSFLHLGGGSAVARAATPGITSSPSSFGTGQTTSLPSGQVITLPAVAGFGQPLLK